MTVGRDEELRAERIANGESEKRLPGALERVKGHLPLIFPERLGEWHAHRVDWSLAPWTLTWDEVDPGRHPFDPDSAPGDVRSVDPASEFPFRRPAHQSFKLRRALQTSMGRRGAVSYEWLPLLKELSPSWASLRPSFS
jgi:hypothetical protein